MAGITQHIPNYIKGMSRQPDELKMPGQVRDAKNCIPDVTKGLQKRPGARLLNALGFGPDGKIAPDDYDGEPGSRRDGTWFDFYIDEGESYIGQINKDGRVEIWGTSDGYPRTVNYTSDAQDFSDVSDGEPASPTCNSEEFIANRDALKLLDQQIQNLDVEVDVLQTELDEYEQDVDNSPDGKPAEFEEVNVYGRKAYVISRGYVIPKSSEQDGSERRFKVDPPAGEDGPGGRRRSAEICMTQSGYKEYTDKRWYFDRPANEEELNELFIFGKESCNIYDFNIEKDKEKEPSSNQGEIDAKKDELESLKTSRDDTFLAYVTSAAQCGSNAQPSEETFRMSNRNNSLNVLEYLQHGKPGDIQTTNIEDRIIVVNRTVPVSLSSEIETVRPAEGYVELKAIAGARTYQFAVDLKAVDAGVTVMRATKLVLSKQKGWKSEEEGGACIFNGNEIFENQTNGIGEGLVFEINTVGSSVVKDPEKPEEGYQCKYTSSIKLLNGGQGWKKGDKVKVTMNGADYTVSVSEVTEDYYTEEFPIFGTPTPTDGSVVITAKEILDDLKSKFDAESALTALGFSCSIIGNGLYVTNDKGFKFTLVTSEWELLNTFGNQVTDVTQLPTQCKAGYICKVSNSDAEADDYYVQFYGTDGKPVPAGDITPKGGLPNQDEENYVRKQFGGDGPGAWYECVKPGLKNIINHSSMPHQIRRTGTKRSAEFIVQPINWADREVGDDLTNPIPRFVGTVDRLKKSDGTWAQEQTGLRFINNCIFYRSRLCFLTNEAIVMSQPIPNISFERFDFWKKTATTLTDSDPIDLVVTSQNPSVLYDALVVNSGLLLFSPNHQHLLSTNQDILSPKTAEVNEIASYRYNNLTTPISMGTTVAFMSNAGKHGRLFEMTNIARETQAEVLEQSKIIADLMPENLDLLTHSKENQIVIAGKFMDRELWIYRYFNDGVERKQAAWVRWELTGDLVYMTIIDDVLFICVNNVFENRGPYWDPEGKDEDWRVVTMQRMDLKETVWSAIVEDYNFQAGSREGRYQAHLDNYRVAWPTDMQYYYHLDQTYFRMPLGYFSDKRLAAYTLKDGKFQGRAIYPRVEIDYAGTWCVLDGDWSGTRLMLGYEFEYSVELPTIYPVESSGNISKSDTTCSLVLHRLHLNLGDNGVYETTLKRTSQRDDYTQLYEARNEDGYLANDVALDTVGTQVVPIYDRNTSFTPNPYGIYITSNHPSPCTLVSMTWEGDYSPKYYKRA